MVSLWNKGKDKLEQKFTILICDHYLTYFLFYNF